jgi:hypothetical protein
MRSAFTCVDFVIQVGVTVRWASPKSWRVGIQRLAIHRKDEERRCQECQRERSQRISSWRYWNSPAAVARAVPVLDRLARASHLAGDRLYDEPERKWATHPTGLLTTSESGSTMWQSSSHLYEYPHGYAPIPLRRRSPRWRGVIAHIHVRGNDWLSMHHAVQHASPGCPPYSYVPAMGMAPLYS